MGGRGASSGANSGSGENGNVIIKRELEPNAQGYSYYVTGSRNVTSYYDDEGNYNPQGFTEKEPIRGRFDTKEQAIRYAKENGFKYLAL